MAVDTVTGPLSHVGMCLVAFPSPHCSCGLCIHYPKDTAMHPSLHVLPQCVAGQLLAR